MVGPTLPRSKKARLFSFPRLPNSTALTIGDGEARHAERVSAFLTGGHFAKSGLRVDPIRSHRHQIGAGKRLEPRAQVTRRTDTRQFSHIHAQFGLDDRGQRRGTTSIVILLKRILILLDRRQSTYYVLSLYIQKQITR